jgi:hypothetical protein
MQNTFQDAALFEPILVFKPSRDQLQPQYRWPSILKHQIRTAITFKAKAGTINPHPILMAIAFKAKAGTINPQPI